MLVTRAISITNFLVATSALSFQVCVLYPWHKQLDDDFEALKMEHLRVLAAIRDTTGGASAEKHKGIREMLNRSWRLIGHSPTSPSSSSSLVAAAQISPHTPQPSIVKSLSEHDDVAMYSRYALAGAACCSFTHAILTPVDIVKTRVQISPLEYSFGIFGGLRKIVASEGVRALTTGLGPTIGGYFLQGAFKFGGYEALKARAVDALGSEVASKHRHTIYLGSSAIAELAGDLVLCPFEAVRIRLVSQPEFGHGLGDGFARIFREEGMLGLYSGLGPILLKQVPYTMAAFLVYENALEQAYGWVDKSTASDAAITGINLGSGLIAGVAAALVSQPADTMLSKINKEKGKTTESTLRRMWKIAKDTGLRGSFAGTRARLVMVGSMTAVQFAIYGYIKKAFGATGGIEIK